MIYLNTDLQQVLREHESTWQSNPAMKQLIDDYAKYHWVLVSLGGLLTVGLAVLSAIVWRRFGRTKRVQTGKWPTEKKLYFSLGVLSSFVGLGMALLVVVNAATALKPLPGFAMLPSRADTQQSQQSAFDASVIDWVKSGRGDVPAVVKDRVDARLEWQQPKAIVTGVLFVLFAGFAFLLSQRLIRRTKAVGSGWRVRERTLFVAELFTVPFALLMMVMFVANTQAAIAPLTISVFGPS
jgi:uncharacterized membrane protein YsdA (DUF1294 family)